MISLDKRSLLAYMIALAVLSGIAGAYAGAHYEAHTHVIEKGLSSPAHDEQPCP